MEFSERRRFKWENGAQFAAAAVLGLVVAILGAAVLSLLFESVAGGLFFSLIGYGVYLFFLGKGCFKAPTTVWRFDGDALHILSRKRDRFRRVIPLAGIQHVGLRNRSDLEVGLFDEGHHAPEFLRLFVGRMRGEDYLDEIERYLDIRLPEHVASFAMGRALHCSRPWQLDAVLPATPDAERAQVSLRLGELAHHPRFIRIEEDLFEIVAQPLLHVTNPQHRCQFAFRGLTVFHCSGLALGQLRIDPRAAGDRTRRLCLQLSNGSELVLDEPGAKVFLDDRKLADMAIQNMELTLVASPPAPRALLLLATAVWYWSWSHGVRYSAPSVDP